MTPSSRALAALAYLPVVGWIVGLLAAGKDPFVRFHVKQGIGLIGFVLFVLLLWVVFSWLISWISFGFLIAAALFALVIATVIFAVVALVNGVLNALRGRAAALPLFGHRASALPL
jgi:uncharacterized membrane protein